MCVCTVVVDWNMLQSTVRDAPGATVRAELKYFLKLRLEKNEKCDKCTRTYTAASTYHDHNWLSRNAIHRLR